MADNQVASVCCDCLPAIVNPLMTKTAKNKKVAPEAKRYFQTTPAGTEKIEDRLRYLKWSRAKLGEQAAQYDPDDPESSKISKTTASNFCTGSRPFPEVSYRALCAVLGFSCEEVGEVIDPHLARHNLSNPSAVFRGRQDLLEAIDQQVLQNNSPSMLALVGMPGVGKSELALQYAWQHVRDYQGGICWVDARKGSIVLQIISFARSCLSLNPPECAEEHQLLYCWNKWPGGSKPVLIVLDDIDGFNAVRSLLPGLTQRFTFLLTSRQQLEPHIPQLLVNLPDAVTAVEILSSPLHGDSRLEAEAAILSELCHLLGYLPLALHLVGNYLAIDQTVTMAEVFADLKENALADIALKETDSTSVAQRGAQAAFELSWERLTPEAQQLACLLSRFAVAPIPSAIVETATKSIFGTRSTLRAARFGLTQTHLAQCEGQSYQLHRLVREFFRSKVSAIDTENIYWDNLCRAVVAACPPLPEKPVREELDAFLVFSPHVEEVGANMPTAFAEQDAILPFTLLVHFYRGQGLFHQGLHWAEKGVAYAKDAFGHQHPHTAIAYKNAALMACLLGDPQKTRPYLQHASTLQHTLTGEDSLEMATLNLLFAVVCRLEGNMSDAATYARKSLAVRERYLPGNHPDVLEARMTEAASLFYDATVDLNALKINVEQVLNARRQILPPAHPELSESINLLAQIHERQGQMEESEPLYREAMVINEAVLGKEHPQTAASYNNLAKALCALNRYEDALPLYEQSVQIFKTNNMPFPCGRCQQNLGKLYAAIGEAVQARVCFAQAQESFRFCSLPDNHPYLLELAQDLQML
jgi:tetratricopeptide (TPR) repeat protein